MKQKVLNNFADTSGLQIDQYTKITDTIQKVNLSNLSDEALMRMSAVLRMSILQGVQENEIIVQAFALVTEAAKRIIGLRPYHTQIIAGLALYEGKIIQMQTGEGKTLAAVMPAYLLGLRGKGVHILTFNDYLAKRDSLWMGPLFNFLGLTVGRIQEGMSREERRKAYQCDITYVTAREAGFDYLRDFLCMSSEEVVLRPYHAAIIDEADSIMIDEARIPLVIAGKQKVDDSMVGRINNLVKEFVPDRHYEVDEYARNIFLTDEGISLAETVLQCGNLYDSRSAYVLSSLYASLYVHALLRRDRDYIVKEDRIKIVDEFTGRIAEKRMFPNSIQTAIEKKEGVHGEDKGVILGSIAMQHFLSLYPHLSGMTGTALSASSEFRSLYRKEVIEVPTYKKSIRVDHPDRIFAGIDGKYEAVAEETERVHKTLQPILIGTRSVEESERLYELLKKRGIPCSVLNAKNDEMEAAIIARAGEPGAVTVSTNMAGRGVDIKLGGEREEQRDFVAGLGGLYIIGTGRHESIRIDNQLRGRAGRQGDPGESRFFISLEDTLFERFNLSDGFKERYCSKGHMGEIRDSRLLKDIARCQRMAGGYNSDMRIQLSRYTYIIEQQRRLIFRKRSDILHDRVLPEIFKEKVPERYEQLIGSVGEKGLRIAEKQLALYHINKSWMEYLEYIEYIRESIHLVIFGAQSPIDEFNRKAIAAFEEMLGDMIEETVNSFNRVEVTENGVNMEREGLIGPASTWTYLMDESADQFSKFPQIVKSVTKAFTGTLFSFKSLYDRIKARLKN